MPDDDVLKAKEVLGDPKRVIGNSRIDEEAIVRRSVVTLPGRGTYDPKERSIGSRPSRVYVVVKTRSVVEALKDFGLCRSNEVNIGRGFPGIQIGEVPRTVPVGLDVLVRCRDSRTSQCTSP